LASDCPVARSANLPEAKEEHSAEPLTDAVAPVISKLGGFGAAGESAAVLRRSGRVLCAKLKKPLPLAS
jgi:hypothetical protein